MNTAPGVISALSNDVEYRGLTQAEAVARFQPGQDNSIAFRAGRTRRQIVLAGVFSVYTFDLVGVAIAFYFLDQPYSALFSPGVLLLIYLIGIVRAFRSKEAISGQHLGQKQ